MMSYGVIYCDIKNVNFKTTLIGRRPSFRDTWGKVGSWFIPLPKKVIKQKICWIPRKWLISDYILLICITSRRCEILHSAVTKMNDIT